MAEKKHRCAKLVSRGSAFSTGPCSRKGTVLEDDERWCKQHAPSAEKQREAEREAKYQTWRADTDRQNRIEDAERAAVKAAVDLYEDQISRSELDDAIYELLNVREASSDKG